MNNNQRFDEHIKTQLSGLEPDVPAHVWENIIAERRKRKPLPFWASFLNSKNLLILFSIILAGLTTTWLVNKTGSSSSPASSLPQHKAIAGVTDKNPAENTALNTTGSDVKPDTITGSPSIKTPAPVTGAQNDAALNSATPGVNAAARQTAFFKTGRYKIKTGTSQPGTATKDNPVFTKDENVPATETLYETGNAIPVDGTLYNRLLLGIERNKGRVKTIPGIVKRKTPNLIIPKCPVEKDASGNKKYVEVYGAIDYGIQSLKDTGASSAYLQKRKESTKFAWAYSAGARYTKVFNNGMSVRGGVNFSQITEKFTFVQGNLVQVTYIIDANGDTTGSYTTTGTRYKTTYNKYRTFDIPLLIGYEMGNGRFHTNINAGPVINIYSWQKGEVLDASNQPVSITTGKSNSVYGFKTNAGIGFMGAVSLYYKLTENLHIMAEPYFRYNFTQMNRTELTIKQKYNTIGLKLGVRLDIP